MDTVCTYRVRITRISRVEDGISIGEKFWFRLLVSADSRLYLHSAVYDGMAEINGGSTTSYVKVDFLFRGKENVVLEIRSI